MPVVAALLPLTVFDGLSATTRRDDQRSAPAVSDSPYWSHAQESLNPREGTQVDDGASASSAGSAPAITRDGGRGDALAAPTAPDRGRPNAAGAGGHRGDVVGPAPDQGYRLT